MSEIYSLSLREVALTAFARAVQELATGALPLAIVKMGTMDRDDKGDKRIPVLMNYLSALFPD